MTRLFDEAHTARVRVLEAKINKLHARIANLLFNGRTLLSWVDNWDCDFKDDDYWPEDSVRIRKAFRIGNPDEEDYESAMREMAEINQMTGQYDDDEPCPHHGDAGNPNSFGDD